MFFQFLVSRKQLLIISERESGMCHASCQKCSQIRDEREREYFFDSDPWASKSATVGQEKAFTGEARAASNH